MSTYTSKVSQSSKMHTDPKADPVRYLAQTDPRKYLRVLYGVLRGRPRMRALEHDQVVYLLEVIEELMDDINVSTSEQ